MTHRAAIKIADLSPKLRLFLSCDIQGSTAKKHVENPAKPKASAAEKVGFEKDWRAAVTDFFSVLPTAVGDNFAAIGSDAHGPFVWKALGDELIYTYEINTFRCLPTVLIAWIKSVNYVRDRMRAEYGLDAKGHAWLAGFPVINAEIDVFQKGFPAANTKKFGPMERDFAGPNMDAGFRLSGFASPRKFVISVEIAYLLSALKCLKPTGSFQKDLELLRLFFDGHQELKGVVKGPGYPLFWVDAELEGLFPQTLRAIKPTETAKMNELEQKLSGRKALKHKIAWGYLENFFLLHPFFYAPRLNLKPNFNTRNLSDARILEIMESEGFEIERKDILRAILEFDHSYWIAWEKHQKTVSDMAAVWSSRPSSPLVAKPLEINEIATNALREFSQMIGIED